ncbi:TonB-dependent receptor [Acidobacteriota bacterium]
MKKRVLLCVIVFLIPIFSQAQDNGRIQGQVKKAGRSLGGVDVILVELSLSELTDKDGVYLFTGIPPGTYTLIFAQGDNYLTKEDIFVTPDTTTKLDVDVDQESLLTHEVTVYGASRHTERIIDAPAAVSVVEEAEIEREAAHGQLAKIMDSTPGVIISHSGIQDFSLNTRGFQGSRGVMVMVDGVDEINIMGGGQEWDRHSASIYDFASVELIRGPGSALYGANAFTGVLNVTTKSPRYSQGGYVRFSIGEMSMGLLDLRYAGKLGKDWYFSVHGGYTTSKDFTVSRLESVEYPGLTMDVVPLPLEKYKRLSAKIRLDKHFASGSILTFETSTFNSEGMTISYGGRLTYLDTPSLKARINFKSKHWNIHVYGWSNDFEGVYLNSGSPLYTGGYRMHGEVLGFTDIAKEKGRIVGGLSVRTEQVDSANNEGIQTAFSEVINSQMGALFGQLDYNFTEKLKVVLAGRLDLSSLHKTPQFSPKASVMYTFNPGHSLRVSYNQAFLTPTYPSLYARFPLSPPVDLSAIEDYLSAVQGRDLGLGFDSIPVLAVGNENLYPRKITSYEIGYSNILGQKLLFNINYYRQQLKNFQTDWTPLVNPDYGPYVPPSDLPSEIQTAILETLELYLSPSYFAIISNSLEDGSPIFAAFSLASAGRANTQGIELGLKYFLNEHLSSYFNYTWFDYDIKEEASGVPSTSNTPEHSINIGASYISDQIDISIRYRWVDDFQTAGMVNKGLVKSYNLVDLTSNVYFGDGFSVGLNISNLLNHKHYQYFGGNILQRFAVATISYRW